MGQNSLFLGIIFLLICGWALLKSGLHLARLLIVFVLEIVAFALQSAAQFTATATPLSPGDSKLAAKLHGIAAASRQLANKISANPGRTLGLCLALSAVITTSIVGMCGTGPNPADGTLTETTSFPIHRDGKQIGAATLPAGTKVTILREDAASNKMLVKTNIGESWVENRKVKLVVTEAPENTPNPKPAETSTPAKTPNTDQPVTAQPVNSEETKGKPYFYGGVKAVDNATMDGDPNQRGAYAFIPKNFNFDMSVRRPPDLIFYELPFEKQAKDGLCVAASAVNMLKFEYHQRGGKDTTNLDQMDLQALFSTRSTGATPWALKDGLTYIGYNLIDIPATEVATKNELENFHPVMVFWKNKHVTVIIGFNPQRNTLINWDPRMDKSGSSFSLGEPWGLKALPQGASEIPMDNLETAHSMYVIEPIRETSQEITISGENIEKGRNGIGDYLISALPTLFKLYTPKGSITIPTETGTIEVTGWDPVKKMVSVQDSDGKTSTQSIRALVKKITNTNSNSNSDSITLTLTLRNPAPPDQLKQAP